VLRKTLNVTQLLLTFCLKNLNLNQLSRDFFELFMVILLELVVHAFNAKKVL
jgi:hypothetical protein